MQIDKSQILALLQSRGEPEKAAQADAELPATVDTEQDAGLLSRFGIDVSELLDKLPGGLGDKLNDKLGGLGGFLGN